MHVVQAQRAQLAGAQAGVGDQRDDQSVAAASLRRAGRRQLVAAARRWPGGEAATSRGAGSSSARRIASTVAGASGATASRWFAFGARTSESGLPGMASLSAAWRSTLESSVRALWIVPALDAGLHERGLPLAHPGDRELAEGNVAERLGDVAVVHARVALARGLRERGRVLGRPALLDPLVERRAAARGELLHGQRPQLVAAADLGVPRFSVALAVEAAGAAGALLAPANLPAALRLADAHAHDAPRL